MENRITTLFGIRYPIIAGGMIWCSGWRLAAAVSDAGGLGLIGAGSMTPDLLREHIRKCRAATGKPFGVNVPLMYRYAEQIMQVVMEERVPAVFTSAGSPKTWTGQLHAAGCKVAHVVSSTKFALKCQEAGVDAVVAEGFEAGGHNGREETATMALVPQVRTAITIPLIAAGGIATGRGMLAAFALGAEGIQMGTRFALSEESSASDAFKRLCIGLEEGGTMLALKKIGPTRLIRNDFYTAVETAENRGASAEELKELLGRGRSKRGLFEGDLADGELEIGQIASLIRDLPPAGEIVRQIIDEYNAGVKSLTTLSRPFGERRAGEQQPSQPGQSAEETPGLPPLHAEQDQQGDRQKQRPMAEAQVTGLRRAFIAQRHQPKQEPAAVSQQQEEFQLEIAGNDSEAEQQQEYRSEGQIRRNHLDAAPSHQPRFVGFVRGGVPAGTGCRIEAVPRNDMDEKRRDKQRPRRNKPSVHTHYILR